jgi:ParB-like chromosome segregation protein Spo0J
MNLVMKIKIKDLNPNPYRNIENYPLQPAKLEALRNSMLKTGFWDNILARQVNGKVEIAYGHHRLEVLKQLFDPDYVVYVPIKDLSDGDMLMIMANENMGDFDTNTYVIDNTVQAAIDYIEADSEIALSVRRYDGDIVSQAVAKYLGWDDRSATLIESAMLRVRSIRDNEIDADALYTISKPTAATHFVRKVKQHKLPVFQQRKVANTIERDHVYSLDGITSLVMGAAYPTKKKEVKVKDDIQKLEDYLSDLSKRAVEFKDEIVALKRLKAELIDISYDQLDNRLDLLLALDSVSKSIINLINELKHEPNTNS